jgi:hypothetical protein
MRLTVDPDAFVDVTATFPLGCPAGRNGSLAIILDRAGPGGALAIPVYQSRVPSIRGQGEFAITALQSTLDRGLRQPL